MISVYYIKKSMAYILYTADLKSPETTITTFTNDTSVLASGDDLTVASERPQSNLNDDVNWLRRWKIKADETISVHITYTNLTGTCPPATLNEKLIPQADDGKNLAIRLERGLN